MIIEYIDTELKRRTIELENAVHIKINGIKITKEDDFLHLNTNERLLVYPNACNSIYVKEEKIWNQN